MKRQMIVFRLGQGSFALDILSVREVAPMQTITPVPETADYVAGVMNLRGSLIPVLDLRRRMQFVSLTVTDETRIIIARCEHRLIGVIVDRASDFIRAEEHEIEPVPQIFHEIGATYVTGLIRKEGQVIALIDLTQALGGTVMEEVGEVIRTLEQLTDEDSAEKNRGSSPLRIAHR